MNKKEATKKYNELIETAKGRLLESISIKHHIKPKSIYPELSNDADNIVRLTNFEHILAHFYLCFMYSDKNRFKMASALQILLDTKFDSLSDIEKVTIEQMLAAAKKLDNNVIERSIRVIQFDKEFNYIAEHKSITDAAEAINFKVSSHISRCCKGLSPRTIKGFIFRYKYDVDSGNLNKEAAYDKRNFKKVTQYDLNGNFIANYDSAGSAEKATGVGHNYITKCCDGKKHRAGEFIWKYTSDSNPDFTDNFEKIKLDTVSGKVNQYNVDGKYIKTFDSVQNAADEYDVIAASIYLAIRTDGKSCGYRWRYEKDDIEHIGIEPYDYKVILQLDNSGNIISEYNNFIEAERATGINYRIISGCCNMKYKTAGGFIWKFKDNYDGDLSWNLSSNKKAVIQYDLDGNFIAEYESCADAAKFLGLKKASAIILACKNWDKLSGNSHWRYKSEVENNI